MRQFKQDVSLARRRPMGVAEAVVFLLPCLISIGSGLMMLGLNLKAVEMGAGFQFLGVLGFVRAGTFLLGSLGLGALSDRIRKRDNLVLLACFLHVVVSILLAWAGSLCFLTLAAAGFSLSEAMLWPPFEAWLGEHTRTGKRRRWLGIFNVGWCSGFALGTSVAGVAKARGGELPFYIAAVVCFLGWMVGLWLRQAGEGLRNEKVTESGSPPLREQPVWMRLSWVANFANIFCFAAIFNLFPRQGMELELSEGLVGVVCGLLIVGELGAFIVTALTTSWQGRIGVLAGVQGVAAVGLVWLGVVEEVGCFVIVFLAVGVSVGIGYSSSLLFSVSSEHGKGIRAAVHEGMAALGGLTAPPLGGVLAGAVGRRMPHLLCGLVLAAGILLELRILRGRKGVGMLACSEAPLGACGLRCGSRLQDASGEGKRLACVEV